MAGLRQCPELLPQGTAHGLPVRNGAAVKVRLSRGCVSPLPDGEVQHGKIPVCTGEGEGEHPVSRLIGDGPMTGVHRLGQGLDQWVCQGAAEGEALELLQQGAPSGEVRGTDTVAVSGS